MTRIRGRHSRDAIVTHMVTVRTHLRYTFLSVPPNRTRLFTRSTAMLALARATATRQSAALRSAGQRRMASTHTEKVRRSEARRRRDPKAHGATPARTGLAHSFLLSEQEYAGAQDHRLPRHGLFHSVRRGVVPAVRAFPFLRVPTPFFRHGVLTGQHFDGLQAQVCVKPRFVPEYHRTRFRNEMEMH